MPQLFSRAADARLRAALIAVVVLPVLSVAVLMAVVRSPWITSQEVRVSQPVPFSHQHHVADAGIDCRYCHTSVEVSPTAGLPSTEICMNCHRELWTDAPALALVRASWRREQPIAWNRVHDLPDFAYFNHSVHVHNGIGCYSCHGRVGEMPLVHQAAPLTMQWCLECHRDPAARVRPRSLIYEPKPLRELTGRPEYHRAVREFLNESPEKPARQPETPPEKSEAEETRAGKARSAKAPSKKAMAETAGGDRRRTSAAETSAAKTSPSDTPAADAEAFGTSSGQLARLRAALAEQYGAKRRTDCYTCHR